MRLIDQQFNQSINDLTVHGDGLIHRQTVVLTWRWTHPFSEDRTNPLG
jgi:hypothetical protein